uniref:Titin n=1 Tax=Buteo japonicus TaxID=224669 RepID=A0A8C0B1S7_9AVES
MAENAAGVSEPSPTSPFYKACDTVFKPGPPGNPRVLDSSKSSITIAWNKPIYDGGSEITGYMVEIALPEEDEWKIVTPPVGLKATSFTITDLKENQEYKIRIYAMNSEGLGEPALVPGTPKAEERMLPPEIELDAELRKVVTIRACCTLRLFVPIKGRPAPEVKWTREHGESLDRASIESTSSYTLLIVENVNRFDSGKYILTIENSSGRAITARDEVEPPHISMDPKYKDTIVVHAGESFRLDADIHGKPIPSIQWLKGDHELTNTARMEIKSTDFATSLSVKEAIRVDSGQYVLLAKNVAGEKKVPVNVKVLDRPGPPEGPVEITGVTAEKCMLSWKPPLQDGAIIDTTSSFTSLVLDNNAAGAISKPSDSTGPITARDEVELPRISMDPKYKDTIVVNAGETFRLEADVHGKPLPTIKWYKGDKELEETARYEIKNTDFSALIIVKDAIRVDGGQYILEASNVAGTKTVPVNVKVLDRPGPPEGPVQVTGVTAEKCSLAWAPPLHDGGSDISHYIVEKRETSRLAWTIVASEVLPTMLKVTKLLEGNEYVFRIMAVNKYGVGEPLESVPVMMKNPFVVPGPPKALEITNITKDSMTVCWSRPDSDGGSEIIGYIVEKRDRAGIRWIKCNKRRITDLRLRVTGLTEDHEYEFRVSAENAAGVSEPSQVSPYFKACDPMFKPGPPTNAHVVDTTKTSVTLAWSKPIYDGVQIDKGINYTQLSIDNCDRNDAGKYILKLENSSGSKSAFVTVKVLDTPGPPQNLVVKDIRKDSAVLSWEPPIIDGGAKVKNYVIDKRESTRKA